MTGPSADDVRKTNMATLANAHAVYIEAVRKTMGKEGLEKIGEANRLHGIKLGQAGISEGGLRKGDPGSIFEFFEAAHPFFGFDLELIEASDTKAVIKVTACPWIDSFKAMDAKPDICDWVCKIDEGIAQAVDPDLRMTLLKCMMRGDDHCIYLWEKD